MKNQANALGLAGLLLTALAFLASASAPTPFDTTGDSWPYYGHDAGGMRYSPLTQINRDNVTQLKVAWTFHTGDVSEQGARRKRSGFETTPLLVDGALYLTTAFNRIIALDPETGKQRWVYDPQIDLEGDYGDGLVNRGVATWLDAARAEDQPCHRSIFESTQDARLVAVDAGNGAPCSDFGKDGVVSLRDVLQYHPGWYHMTSPPIIIDDLVVVGSAIDDNHRADMARGVVRAYDALSGALRWSWDPLPANPAAAAAQAKTPAWRSGAGNAWSIMAVDPARDLLFVPTGSASPDYYGGLRPGDDKWANSVVALRGKTGAFVWGFQLVHHDLWDFDSAAPPLLTTLHLDGKDVPVVIQGNKSGLLYVLHRDTGKPVFPVEERPVPKSAVPGEVASPTQPFPVKPPPLVPHTLSADQAWGPTPEDRDWCRNYIGKLRNEGIYTPPSLEGTLMVPGNIGGMTWSGYAFDPQRGLLVTNVNNLVAIARLIPREKYNDRGSHAEDGDYGDQLGAAYGLYRRFIQSPSDLPCSPPPWGTLSAVDMNEGKIRWQVPLGSMQDFGGTHPQQIPPGSISLGGPILTAGGLVFIAGATDCFLRAFDIESGKELWKAKLPACGNATPMTYRVSASGKQYVVIAAGGHPKITEEKLGDTLVAFALP
ncbi:MAG TPA: pyrroloquinoline quinone-dependent dehydrogenase [Candidatus Acidoferrum sp.]|nr:pyrroloquinoline quinone-dependent dehydrogenase [Candidatus Acidoferrum sp.]